MKVPEIKTKDLLSVTDLTRDEILGIFKFAAKLKKDLKQAKPHPYCSGKTLGMIFEKNSTRTRVSFETGMFQLGGHALFLSRDDIQLGRGETIGDTAKVLSRYVDGIMIRAYSHAKVTELARCATIPVINGLTDLSHPCQALSDFFTIYEREKDFKNIKMAYVGDGNNVAHSLMLCAALLGMDLAVASPKNYQPDTDIAAAAFRLSSDSGAKITLTTDINLAVENAHYLYTDVWISMGQEREAGKRKKAFANYKITKKIMQKCAERCAIMHCLPAHRGEEIDADVLDSNQSIIFDQAENRLHVQKAIMCALIH